MDVEKLHRLSRALGRQGHRGKARDAATVLCNSFLTQLLQHWEAAGHTIAHERDHEDVQAMLEVSLAQAAKTHQPTSIGSAQIAYRNEMRAGSTRQLAARIGARQQLQSVEVDTAPPSLDVRFTVHAT